MSRTTYADALLDILSRQRIRMVFGVTGTQNIDLFEALRGSDIQTVPFISELGAAFAANGYGRATGRPSVLLTIPGPGFTAALPGIAEARQDSVPLLWIVPFEEGETGFRYTLQTLDLEKIASSIVKEIVTIRTGEEFSKLFPSIAVSTLKGEPGPVLALISASLLRSKFDGDILQPPIDTGGSIERRFLLEAIDKIRKSSYPIIFTGMGAADSSEHLRILAEKLQCPVITTLSGRGVVSEDHALSIPHDFSLYNPTEVLSLFSRSDCIVALGLKFSHNGTGGFRLPLESEKLIHIDSSTESLTGNPYSGVQVCARLEDALPVMVENLSEYRSNWQIAEIEAIKMRALAERKSVLSKLPTLRAGDLESLFSSLSQHCADGGLVFTDSGLHQSIARSLLSVRRARSFITPSDFQSMGYGIPAAIGAALSDRSLKVISVVGDGGFFMSGFELAIAVKESLDLGVIVFTDGAYGLIRRQQVERYGREFCTSLPELSIEKFSSSLGIQYQELSLPLERSLKEFRSGSGVRILEIPVVEGQRERLRREVSAAKSIVREYLS